jgi:hypothetical protein
VRNTSQRFVYNPAMMEALKVSRQMSDWNDENRDTGEEVVKRDIARIEGQMKAGFAAVDARFEQVDARFEQVEGQMKEGFDKVDARFKEAEQASSAIGERLARMETKLEGFARLERLVWGFGSALLIAAVGPRLF